MWSSILVTCSMRLWCQEGCCSHASFARSRSPRGLLLYSSLKGANPVELWGTSLMVNSTYGSSWSQSRSRRPYITPRPMALLSASIKCWSRCSERPLWKTEVQIWPTRSSLHIFFRTCDIKHVPWSVSISLAMPTRLNRSNSSLATAFPIAIQRGTASGYPVA